VHGVREKLTFLGVADQKSNIKSTYRRQVTFKICMSSSDKDLRNTIRKPTPPAILWLGKDCRMSAKSAILVREIENPDLGTTVFKVCGPPRFDPLWQLLHTSIPKLLFTV